jgi:hypothetical protein
MGCKLQTTSTRQRMAPRSLRRWCRLSSKSSMLEKDNCYTRKKRNWGKKKKGVDEQTGAREFTNEISSCRSSVEIRWHFIVQTSSTARHSWILISSPSAYEIR